MFKTGFLTFLLAWILVGCKVPGKTTQSNHQVTVADYAKIAAGWFTIPVSANLKILQSKHLGGMPGDTSVINYSLVALPGEMYLISNNVEQLANDSIWVLIDNDRKFISVYGIEGGYENYLKAQLSQASPNDSIIKQWINDYEVKSSIHATNQSVMEIVPKEITAGNASSFSGKVYYNNFNHLPSKILISKESSEAINISDSTLLQEMGADYITDTSNAHLPVMITKIEYRTEIIFLKIERNDEQMPKRIKDFVALDGGRYKATTQYSGYEIFQY
jgi:hypothetical protein